MYGGWFLAVARVPDRGLHHEPSRTSVLRESVLGWAGLSGRISISERSLTPSSVREEAELEEEEAVPG
jgi:hypothetical protein